MVLVVGDADVVVAVVVRNQAGAAPMEDRHPIGPAIVFRWSWHGPKRRTRAAGGRGHGHA